MTAGIPGAPPRPGTTASPLRTGEAAPDPPAGAPADAAPLDLKPDWSFEVHGERRHYLVEARLSGRCIGRAYGWYETGGRFVLEKIELDPEHRSRGYGSTVIAALRAQARDAGCTELVFKGVRSANAGAIRLYESLGAVGTPTSDDLRSFVLTPP
ncbi:GNAT family N-acetyltransferase [Lysobacter xanthus]